MIIKSFQIDKINNSQSNFFLIYGENEGLKNQIIEKNIFREEKNKFERFDENEIINNVENFISGILNKSFFQEKRYIIISRPSEKILKLIEEIYDREIIDVKIVIKSTILDKKSKLRNFFEKEKSLVCIPVYEDQNNTLSLIATKFFNEKKISISRESVNILIDRCNGDRHNLNNELNKIYLYTIGKTKISNEEITKITNLAENYDISELADNCLSKNFKRTTKILNENNFNQEDCMIIIRTILSKSKRLINLSRQYESNKDVNQTITMSKPPIFWKDKEIVKKQIQSWNTNDLEKLIFKINDIELLIKKNYNSSVHILYNFILETSFSN